MYDITTQTTFQDHVQVEELEKRYFRPEVIASAQTTWAWGQANTESLFLLRDKEQPQKLIGHLSAFPVRQELSNRLIAGEMKDTEIPPCAILPYGTDIPADLYFAVICIDKAHRPRASLALLSFFMTFLSKKIEGGQGNALRLFLAEAGTRDGQRLLDRRGLHPCHPGAPLPCFYQTKLTDLANGFTQRIGG